MRADDLDTRALQTPSILVGIGTFGVEVARRLATEAAEELRRAVRPDRETDAWAEEVRASGLELVTAQGTESSEALAARIAERARALLAHGRLSAARDAPGRDGPTRLHVLVIGHLGEERVRSRLRTDLAAMEAALLERLGPIFAGFRTGRRRNLVVLPLLAMPHPHADRSGEQVASTLRGLTEAVAATPARERAVPQVYAIEDVAEFSVLSEPELAQCVRNFATFLLHAVGEFEDAESILYGRDQREPLATFACSVAELPRTRLRRYGVGRVALELLDAIDEAPIRDASVQRLDVLERVELAALDGEDESEGDVRSILERYAPVVERDPEPRWWTRSETLRDRYGPDPGDASSNEAQPPPEPPVGWALARMETIEAGWRLLQRRRFDDLIARERRQIEETRDALVGRIRGTVDETLWAEPRPEAFRQAAALVDIITRETDERLENAVAERDAVRPPPAPSFDQFRDAHAAFLDACRRKPDLGRMLFFGALFVAAFVAFGPTLLGALADATGAQPTDWHEPLLRKHAGWTAAGLGLLYASVTLGVRFRSGVRAVREAFHAMFAALEDTVAGATGSLLDYFTSRLRLARNVARVEALLSVQGTLTRDRERLTLLDRAVRRARSRLLDEQRALGVRRDAAGNERLSGLLGTENETLVEALTPPEAEQALKEALPSISKRARIEDVLQTLAREHGYAKRWREEVPFTDIDALRRACAPHAETIAEWDPFASPEMSEATAAQIARFVRRQARSLRVALEYAGHETNDPTGISTFARGDVIVPPAAYEGVKRQLQDEGAAGRALVPVHRGVEADRAYYLVASGDIDLRAVPTLAPRTTKDRT